MASILSSWSTSNLPHYVTTSLWSNCPTICALWSFKHGHYTRLYWQPSSLVPKPHQYQWLYLWDFDTTAPLSCGDALVTTITQHTQICHILFTVLVFFFAQTVDPTELQQTGDNGTSVNKTSDKTSDVIYYQLRLQLVLHTRMYEPFDYIQWHTSWSQWHSSNTSKYQYPPAANLAPNLHTFVHNHSQIQATVLTSLLAPLSC